MELAANLGGVTQDICAGNWRASMRALGLDTFAYRTCSPCGRCPRAETIQVRGGWSPSGVVSRVVRTVGSIIELITRSSST